jgi:hypothetical protein
MSHDKQSVELKPGADVLAYISDAIKGIRFGSIEITVQDGKVVQVERKEKIRINPGNKKAGDKTHKQ